MATNPVEAAGKDPTNPDDSSLPRENPIATPGKISGLGAQLGSQHFSIREAIGGPWGALEATLPTILVVVSIPSLNPCACR